MGFENNNVGFNSKMRVSKNAGFIMCLLITHMRVLEQFQNVGFAYGTHAGFENLNAGFDITAYGF